MRIHKYIAFGAVAVAALVLLAQPVQASCSYPAIIQSVDDSVEPSQWSHIWTEDYFAATFNPYIDTFPYSTEGPPYSPNFDAVWWEMGRGEANNGTNIFNEFPYWIEYIRNENYPPNIYYYGAQLFGGWGQGGVADCVTTGACTCVLLSDAHNNAGYFAITGNNNDVAVQTTELRQPGVDGKGNATPIVLKPIPVPYFISSSRFGDTISLELRVEAEPAADYQLGTCDCVSGYLLYTQTSTGAAPTDRDVNAGWILVPDQPAGGTPFGELFNVDVICSGNEDIYFATQVVGDQGFSTNVVSGNSAYVECEPGLADPVDDQPLRPFQVDRDRRNPRQGRQGR